MVKRTYNDDKGWKRGEGAYSKADSEWNPTTKRAYDSFTVKPDHELDLLDNQADQPAGKMLGGGGPVNKNKHVGKGPPRFKYAKGHGPIGNMQKPK